jgi:CBS domain-containing protein
MHVKNILSAKGSKVVSIEPTATLETAVRTLAEHKIGALLVLGPDRRIIGILSERDIVRARGAWCKRAHEAARASHDAESLHLQPV